MDVRELWDNYEPYLLQIGLTILAAILLLAVGFWLINWLSRQVAHLMAKRNVDVSVAGFLTNFLKIGLKVLLLLSIAGMFGVETTSFIAILSALFTWLMFRTLLRHAGSLVPLTGLASTFLALAVTALLTDGISISGWGWLWGTLVVWVLSMFIWVLPGPWRRYKKTGSAGRPSDGSGGAKPF